jgi:hypothetical protein
MFWSVLRLAKELRPQDVRLGALIVAGGCPKAGMCEAVCVRIAEDALWVLGSNSVTDTFVRSVAVQSLV